VFIALEDTDNRQGTLAGKIDIYTLIIQHWRRGLSGKRERRRRERQFGNSLVRQVHMCHGVTGRE